LYVLLFPVTVDGLQDTKNRIVRAVVPLDILVTAIGAVTGLVRAE
jgi:hypothetical protein